MDLQRAIIEGVIDLLLKKIGNDALVLFGDGSGEIREQWSTGHGLVALYGTEAIASWLLDEEHPEVVHADR